MSNHQITTLDTYIYLVKENIVLFKKILDLSHKKAEPFDPSNTPQFYKSRARHLQSMTLLGITAEHLIKLVLLKRGFSITEVDSVKSTADIPEIKYSNRTIVFDKAANLFINSNPDNYFDGLKVYKFNVDDMDYEYSYFGYKEIDPKTCIRLIQKIRNNYVHKADSQGERNGIIWYVYDFIIWLSKKEFPDIFSRSKYIGNNDIKKLFTNKKS